MGDRADGPGPVGSALPAGAERRSTALLAEVGRVLGGRAPLAARLSALVAVAAGPFGGSALVTLLADDGRTTTAAAAPADPAPEPPDGDRWRAALAAPGASVLPGVPRALVVPLRVDGTEVGALTFAAGDPGRGYDDGDLALATEVGHRVALALEGHRLREHAAVLAGVATGLARAATTAEATTVLADGIRRGLDVGRVGLHRLTGDGRLELLHLRGYPDTVEVDQHAHVRVSEALPLTDAVARREPLWIESTEELLEHYPHLAGVSARTGTQGLAVLPTWSRGAVSGAIALGFDRSRAFRPDDRELAAQLASLAGPAFERTVEADERRTIAETLQRALLPDEPPLVARVPIACRYLPAAQNAHDRHTRAGGDWFDVIELDGGRLAIAVGDVVGHGAEAAAVMGQLRSVLAAHLFDGDGPSTALRKLDRFAGRVPRALASTALCLVLDPEAGTLCWSGAGHVPPLLVDADGPRYLDAASGCVLGVTGAPAPVEEEVSLRPGTTVLLYTDGLVERRTESLDAGLDRLAREAAARAPQAPEELVEGLLGACLGADGPADDVAVVAARLAPGPLTACLPAEPSELPRLRDRVAGWAALAALPAELLGHLQLALGEAVANAVEHAHVEAPPGRPREVDVRVELVRGGVRAVVRDAGRWRTGRDPGRGPGHGLAVVRGLAPDAEIEPGPDGTVVRFTLRG